MARASRVQSEATAAEVLRVAGEMFTAQGYAGVGLEEVAARVGVTRGAVYHHYASKAGLFSAVHTRAQEAVGTAIDAATADLDDAWEALVAGCHVFLTEVVADERRRILLVDGPAVLGWQRWREGDAATSGRQLRDVLGGLAAAGRLRALDVDATTALLSGAMNEAALWVAESTDRAAALQRASAGLDLLLQGVRA